jgi:hypothetical protein
LLLHIIDPTESYLEHLLFSLTVDVGGSMDDGIAQRFAESAGVNGGVFTSDFKLETVLKSCMYWAFKAGSELKIAADAASPPTEEGYLNLLKSYWIFRKFRVDTRSDRMAKEFQAILALVSTVWPAN